MGDWVFVLLVPLLVLPIILLFRFVGCGFPNPPIEGDGPQPSQEPPPQGQSPPQYKPVPTQVPSYKDTILADPSVIAYWRLVDDSLATVAKDEKNFQNGKYIIVPWPGLETEPGSEEAAGNFDLNEASLIVNEPASTKCRIFRGGYVLVEFYPGLYTDEFTIEAWVRPEWPMKLGHDHMLVGAGGYYLRPLDPSPSWHGFWVFADASAVWRVHLAQEDGNHLVVMQEAADPIVNYGETTHLAVTVKTDGSEKRVTMFVHGKPVQGVANKYSTPNGAPLFIGVKNTELDPSNPPVPRKPVLSPIQEVVLYNKALSAAEIKKHYDIGIGKGGA